MADEVNASTRQGASRIVQLDALRGLAALAVVLFHFTARYDELFGHASEVAVRAWWGAYGVDLFFILSGLVICMSLDRASSAADFMAARFSRLYPVYWAAALVTAAIVAIAGLPGQEISVRDALLNATMIQQLLGARHIDGAYWSLQVELLFYAAMMGLHRLGALRFPSATLLAWLGLAVGVHVAGRELAAESSTTLCRLETLFGLRHIPLFGLGIVMCRVLSRGRWTWSARALLGACLAVQWLFESLSDALVIAAFAGIVFQAAKGRPRFLAARPLAWLGSISYTLYLVHQNVGYVFIRALEASGVDPHLAIAAAFVGVVSIATLLSQLVERPAMRRIKNWYAKFRAFLRTYPISGLTFRQKEGGYGTPRLE